MMVKRKPIWVKEEIHNIIKENAQKRNQTMEQYLLTCVQFYESSVMRPIEKSVGNSISQIQNLAYRVVKIIYLIHEFLRASKERRIEIFEKVKKEVELLRKKNGIDWSEMISILQIGLNRRPKGYSRVVTQTLVKLLVQLLTKPS